MATEREISSIPRPPNFTSVDWNDSHYRTSVASSLVQGVYNLQSDREHKRVGSNSQAKQCWEMFHFTLIETLVDVSDSSIYGAIFEYNFSYNFYNYQNTPEIVPPRYVIAFRGTLLKEKTWVCDTGLDIRIIFDSLHRSKRFGHAVEAVQTMVLKHGDKSLWLAGHSLGAGLALLAGKIMAMSGIFLESYIFNPPVSSIPLEQLIKSKVLKGGLRVAGTLFKAGVAMIFKDIEVQEADRSMNLAMWIPNLYVNASDTICAEYIGYFKNKALMSKVGLRKIENIATKNPLRSLFVGKGGTSSMPDSSNGPLHLLPSAHMTVNMEASPNGRRSHALEQWWEPLSNAKYVLYQFNS